MTTIAPTRPRVEGVSWDFEQIYEEYRERIYRYIRHLVTEQELAEDLVQETFTRAYKALPRMPGDLLVN